MNNVCYKNGLVLAIVFLFIGTSIAAAIGVNKKELNNISRGDIENNNIKDFYIDLATKNVAYDNDVVVYLSNGDGTFGNRTDYHIGEDPRELVAGDFNNDYNLDIVIANYDKNYLSFLYGYGNGSFQGAQNYNVGHTTYAIFPYDFNSDGNLDLALANHNHANMSILLGNGDGTFIFHYGCNISGGPFCILGEDFDNDGNIDLVITRLYKVYISILYGYGNGTFGDPLDLYIGKRASYMTSGDFNNDQNMDLALLTKSNHDYISILLNLGNGSFSQQDIPSEAFLIQGIATADLNNDNILDLISSEWLSYPDDRGRILFGNGDGTFGHEKFIDTEFAPGDIVSKDLNGDQNIDLGIVHGSSDIIRIFIGDGTGNFTRGGDYPAGRSPHYLIAECFRTPPFSPILEGPTYGVEWVEYNFNVSASDPNGNDVWYHIDWGDDTNTGWFGPYSSGEKITQTHLWNENGIYTIRAKSKNSNNVPSLWSEPLIISLGENEPPSSPIINGPNSGKVGISYRYIFNSVDLDSDDVKFFIDWGDNNTEWTDFFESGFDVEVKHSWSNVGTYIIKAKASDKYGAKSDWTVFIVTMPKNKAVSSSLLLQFLERFPLLKQLFSICY